MVENLAKSLFLFEFARRSPYHHFVRFWPNCDRPWTQIGHKNRNRSLEAPPEVNIDLILGLLKDQLYLYPHLRLIIASATIDHETFVTFYGGEHRVPFIESRGIQHPVQKHWWGAVNPLGISKSAFDEWWKKVNGGRLPTRQQLPRAIGELVSNICGVLDGVRVAEGARLEIALTVCDGVLQISITVADPET